MTTVSSSFVRCVIREVTGGFPRVLHGTDTAWPPSHRLVDGRNL